MVREAKLTVAEHGSTPSGEGWFVVNARDAAWLSGAFGAYTRFEGDARFASLGINIGVMAPGQASCYYHREDTQEDFLVLSGECLLIIEGEERHLRQWDFVHCPPWTEHVFVGAGDGPCAVLAVGNRPDTEVVYPASELARRHRAAVAQETSNPEQAYADIAPDVPTPFEPAWLPGG